MRGLACHRVPFGPPKRARAWLLAIARREHARLYERKQFLMISLDDLVAGDDVELASAPNEDFSDVGAAISALEPEYRKPLVLQALMGYSTSEIASLDGPQSQRRTEPTTSRATEVAIGSWDPGEAGTESCLGQYPRKVHRCICCA